MTVAGETNWHTPLAYMVEFEELAEVLEDFSANFLVLHFRTQALRLAVQTGADDPVSQAAAFYAFMTGDAD